MSEENALFLFTFSAESTAELLAGNVSLSSGGLRRPDGTTFELAKPVMLESTDIGKNKIDSVEELIETRIRDTNKKLDQAIASNQSVSEIAWMNYAVNCRTYEMTYQGFQSLIKKLDCISVQFSDLQIHLANKEYNDILELNNKHKNNLQTIAGVMDNKEFNAGVSALTIEPMLNEIQAYFERMYSELKSRVKEDQQVLGSIIFLLKPYCYVVRKYSALYYYENGVYPSNYQIWVDVLSRIIKDHRFKSRMEYILRVNSSLTLEEVLNERHIVIFNLKNEISQIKFDRRYAICHSKEQYLSIKEQLQNKIECGDYKLIDGHLCIEL